MAREVSVICAKRESKTLLMFTVIFVVADLKGNLRVAGAFGAGAGDDDRGWEPDGGTGVDPSVGAEGVVVGHGLCVGGNVGKGSGGDVDGGNGAGRVRNLLRTSENICVA